MYKPLVSIIIPVYNGANFLREAIESALAQTYNNIEVIVVNDGSDDNGETEKIALSYGEKIRYFYKENGGSSSALNYGIEKMDGDYFSWLSHDDLYEVQRVERMVKKIKPDIRDIQVIVCGSSLINKDGKSMPTPDNFLRGELDRKDLFLSFQKGRRINGCGIIIPKTVIKNVGIFDEKLRYVNDADYWYRLAIYGCTFTCFDEKLVKSRVHGEQVTVKKANLFRTESKRLSEKVFDALLIDVDKNIDLIYIYLKKAAIDNNIDNVKKVLKKLKSKRQFWWNLSIFYSYFYGRIRAMVKFIYKKLVYKR